MKTLASFLELRIVDPANTAVYKKSPRLVSKPGWVEFRSSLKSAYLLPETDLWALP
jgi:hypothetical protein